MKTFLGWSSALCLSIGIIQAQETNTVEKLNTQLKQMQESFDQQQREMRANFEKLLREQQAQIDALRKQLEASKSNSPPTVAPTPMPATYQGQMLAQGQGTTATNSTTAPAAERWSPSSPIRIGSTQNYINLSFDGLFAAGTSTANDIDKLELGGHDPNQRGFTVQNLETVFEGKVDPYFRGQANIVFQIDREGESLVEVEEAFAETMSLPYNLQVKGGAVFHRIWAA